MNRLLSKLHLIVKGGFFGIFSDKFLGPMYAYALKIYKKTCAKIAHFSNQSEFRKKSNKWVYLNGAFYREEEAMIPVTDRGFLFGDGMFTTMRVNNGQCEFFDAHIQRLQKQAEVLQFFWEPFPFECATELIQMNAAWHGIWAMKIVVTVKEESDTRRTGCILATIYPYVETYLRACHLSIFPIPLESPLAHIKSLAYLDHLYVRNFARKQNSMDAIVCTQDGIILETGCSNIFWIDHDILYVPDPQLPYLQGIILKTLLLHCPLPICVVKMKIEAISVSAHVYICNAMIHCRPVLSIENRFFSRNFEWEALLDQTIEKCLFIT